MLGRCKGNLLLISVHFLKVFFSPRLLTPLKRNLRGLFWTAQINSSSGGSHRQQGSRDERPENAASISQRRALDHCTFPPAQTCFLLIPSTHTVPLPHPHCVIYCLQTASVLTLTSSVRPTEDTSSPASVHCFCAVHFTLLDSVFSFLLWNKQHWD